MFNITKKPEFTHTVTVLEPTDGGHTETDFKARFRVISDEEKNEFLKDGGTPAFLKAIIVSFEDIVGDDDKPMPYNDALRDQMIAIPYVNLALVNTYIRAVLKARVKN